MHLARSFARLAAILGAATFGLLLTAAPASAHDELLGTDPVAGASLAAPPAAATFTYGEPVAAEFTEASVTPPGGAAVALGADKLIVDGLAVSVPLIGIGVGAPAGNWQIVLRIVSTDGHPVESTLEFTAAAAPAAATSPAETSSVPAGSATSGAASAATAAPGSATANSQSVTSAPGVTTIAASSAAADGGGGRSTGTIAAVAVAAVVLLGGAGAFLIARRR